MGASEIRNLHRSRLDNRSSNGQQSVSDIVERLLNARAKAFVATDTLLEDAAAEIKRLQAENAGWVKTYEFHRADTVRLQAEIERFREALYEIETQARACAFIFKGLR